MNPLIDPLLDTTDGGSPPRRRSLADSMIAGRRRPGARSSEPAESEKKPAAPRRRGPRTQQTEEEPAKPASRSRRRPAARKTEDQPPEAAATEETTDVVEEPEAAAEVEVAVEEPEAPADVRSVVEQLAKPLEEPVAAASSAAPQDLQGIASEVTQLRALIEHQRGVLAEVRAGLVTLAQQVDRSGYRPRLGVFVDVPNVMYGLEGEGTVHMGKLLDLLREGRELIRATAYSPVSDDPREPLEQQKFVAPFVPYDYRIVTKPLKRFADGSIKGNFDVEMAIDMLSMADRVDVLAIVSGDADFARAVEAVQARGVRVEVIAFAGSASLEMRALADHYLDLSTVVSKIT